MLHGEKKDLYGERFIFLRQKLIFWAWKNVIMFFKLVTFMIRKFSCISGCFLSNVTNMLKHFHNLANVRTKKFATSSANFVLTNFFWYLQRSFLIFVFNIAILYADMLLRVYFYDRWEFEFFEISIYASRSHLVLKILFSRNNNLDLNIEN